MAEENRRLPDFIIGGAMKSATTSLHYLLAEHPRIFIPPGEINFFSLDDTDENRAYFCNGQRVVFDLDGERERYLSWYASRFAEAGADQLVGEDSTVYLPSRRAARRIAREMPQAKLIFLLREPVARTYSHYWHTVGRGIAVRSFEKAMRWTPGRMLSRSYYRRQLENYYDLFPRENILVLLFEEFVRDVEGQVGRVVDFLGLPPMERFDRSQSKKNTGNRPISIPFRFLHNRILRTGRWYLYPSDLPPAGDCRVGVWPRLAETLHRGFNRYTLTSRRYPPMKPDTRAFLERLFEKENRGLAELIGHPLSEHWPYMRE